MSLLLSSGMMLLAITLAQPQFGLDRDPACVARSLAEGRLSALVEISDGRVPCQWSGDGLEQIRLARSRSRFSRSNKPRTNNLRLAAKEINGLVLQPGEFFSFNDRVGERTEERGYLVAPVFTSTGAGLSTGGGVCQISSGLYNAALLAGMEILERHPHRYRVKYVKPGLDATVDYGRKDLKFRNPFPFPVRLEADEYEGGKLQFAVYAPMRLSHSRYDYDVLDKVPSDMVNFRVVDEVEDALAYRGKPGIIFKRVLYRRYHLTGRRRVVFIDEEKYRPKPWGILVEKLPYKKRFVTGLSQSEIFSFLEDTSYMRRRRRKAEKFDKLPEKPEVPTATSEDPEKSRTITL